MGELLNFPFVSSGTVTATRSNIMRLFGGSGWGRCMGCSLCLPYTSGHTLLKAWPLEFHPACAKALGSSHCSLWAQLPRHVLGWVLVKSTDPCSQPQAHRITVSGGWA